MADGTCNQIEHAHQEWITALDAIDDAIFIHDKDFCILRCNKAYQRFAGVPFEEIIGHRYFEVFPKSNAPLDSCIQEQKKPTEKGHEETVQVEKTFFRSISYAISDKNGKYLYSIHILEDITERLLSQESLKKSELKFKTIFDGAQDGIVVADVITKKITMVNTQICKMLGYTQKKMLSLYVDDIHPTEDLPYVLNQFERQAKGEIKLAKELPVKRKDGTIFFADVNTSSFMLSDKNYVAGFFRDVTEQKLSEEKIQEEKSFSESLIQSLPGLFFFVDHNAKMVRWNKKFEELAGLSSKEMAGTDVMSFVHEDDREYAMQNLQKAFNLGNASVEIRLLLANDVRFYTITGHRIKTKFGMNVVGIGIDITDRIKSEERLKLFRTLIDHSNDAIEIVDPSTLNFIDVNETECKILGYSREEMLSMNIFDIDVKFDEKSAKKIQRKIQREGSVHFETIHRRKDGSTFPVDAIITLIKLEKPYILSIIRDITERVQTEKLLRKSEEKFRSLVESTSDLIWEVDNNGIYTYVSPQVEILLGYKQTEMLGKSILAFIPKDEVQDIRMVFKKFVDKQMPIVALENNCIHKDGHIVVLETSGIPFFDENKKLVGYRGIDRDITERKESEVLINRANRTLKTLFAVNLALVKASNEDELIHTITNIIVQTGGYALATIVYAENDKEKSMILRAWSGDQGHYFYDDHLSWEYTPKSQLPSAKAIRKGTTQVCRNIQNEPGYKPWKYTCKSYSFESNIALPLLHNGTVFGALSIYSNEVDLFDEEEIKLLEELANDLVYGIFTLRTRVEHEQNTLQLQQSLEQSIQAIADTLESRDPYTAGHQRRVTELATAIAKEMNLPPEQIRGVEFAGIIHDLGKIHVPAEILSKPGKLNELEYKLIQMHPQTGYDILKNINFPWPIAETILQHHEKIDGSGYPQGLFGDEILLEAKIISVADVVEAISSHRPYRPSRGIKYALDEIKAGRGSAYDPVTVDACLKIFHEKKFNFST
ncbi:MAG: PAS domain S-box protein [Sulfurospirillaceae bacterium]|nr:PAS domain S-box protein [Sulfurospirillaceae bacterium]